MPICSAQSTGGAKQSTSRPPVLGQSTVTGNGVKNYIPIWTAPTSLSSSVIYQNPIGNVGIGTNAPAATLDVNGSINAATSYELGGNTVLYSGSPELMSIFVGQGAGSPNSRGSENAFLGNLAGHSNAAGGGNAFFGYEAGMSNTTGGSNSFVGMQAGSSNTTGAYNSIVGFQAGYPNTTGQNNSFFGNGAGFSNTTGPNNVSLGANSGGSNNTHNGQNVFVGVGAGLHNSAGADNTIVGFSAGNSNTTGSYNVFYGLGAGAFNTAGNSNVYLNTTVVASIQKADSGSRRQHYKKDYDKGPRTLQYGLIAEEVAKTYPELVSYDTEGKPFSVRYQYLSILLLGEMQKQYHRA